MATSFDSFVISLLCRARLLSPVLVLVRARRSVFVAQLGLIDASAPPLPTQPTPGLCLLRGPLAEYPQPGFLECLQGLGCPVCGAQLSALSASGVAVALCLPRSSALGYAPLAAAVGGASALVGSAALAAVLLFVRGSVGFSPVRLGTSPAREQVVHPVGWKLLSPVGWVFSCPLLFGLFSFVFAGCASCRLSGRARPRQPPPAPPPLVRLSPWFVTVDPPSLTT